MSGKFGDSGGLCSFLDVTGMMFTVDGLKAIYAVLALRTKSL